MSSARAMLPCGCLQANGTDEKGAKRPFDELSMGTVEGLKKIAMQEAMFKKMEPLIDWSFSLADGQFNTSVQELCSEDLVDVVSMIEAKEAPVAVVKELSDALDAAMSTEEAVTAEASFLPWLSWRQLARVNSDELGGDGQATRDAVTKEREEFVCETKQIQFTVQASRIHSN